VLMGSDDVPAIFHDAATFLSKYTFPFSRDDNTHVMPKLFLLWCREQDIVLRKQLSMWLDAEEEEEESKEFACTSIEWKNWAHLIYGALREAVILEEIISNKVPPVFSKDGNQAYELYEVSLTHLCAFMVPKTRGNA
jgi:hypothetical protein